MLRDPSLTNTVHSSTSSSNGELPTCPHSMIALRAKKKKNRIWGGDRGKAGERAGRETELIIQIQSLKGKCVFKLSR